MIWFYSGWRARIAEDACGASYLIMLVLACRLEAPIETFDSWHFQLWMSKSIGLLIHIVLLYPSYEPH